MSAGEVQKLEGRALTLLNQGRLVEALQLYEQICGADEANANAWLRRGTINGMLNRTDQAIDCCRRATALLPDSVEMCMHLASALLQGNKWADAIEQCEKATQMAPGSATAWFMLGRSRAEQGLLEEAIDAFRKGLVWSGICASPTGAMVTGNCPLQTGTAPQSPHGTSPLGTGNVEADAW